MEQFNISNHIVIIPTILCVFLIIITFLIKKNKHLKKQLIKTTITLEVTRKKLDALQEKHSEIKAFKNTLDVAELTTKLQKPRLDVQINETNNSTPGKYSEVQSLAGKGMSAEEIASVLSISTHEAHQLVNLAKLAQGHSANNIAD
ncbi:MAG: hypothetical protein GQ541_04195 [Desulfovibrionaceae bacterium]|nr:hypothetical protein [Desulfovibrionaceae bacterium]